MVFCFHTCKKCGKSIISERLEVFPETKICKDCSEKSGSDIVIKRHTLGMDLDTYKDLMGAIRS